MNILITSAAYVEPEMVAEYGKLPPSFLPLGNQRLIHVQIEHLAAAPNDRIFLSVPQSFAMEPIDETMLASLGITIIRAPDGLSLGNSVLYCLTHMHADGHLRILHGDTLLALDDLSDVTTDCWAISQSASPYSWGVAFSRQDSIIGTGHQQFAQANQLPDDVSTDILIGYFSFSDANSLANALRYSNGDFLTALARYASEHKVKPLQCDSWSDFGHLQTFYQARSTYAATRSFNALSMTGGIIRKSSKQSTKIASEAYWFTNLPSRLKIYTGRLIDASPTADGGYQYATEYEYLPTLQDLYVFGRLDQGAWHHILDSCQDCLEQFAATPCQDAPDTALQLLGATKTYERLSRFERESGLNLSLPTMLNGQPLPSPLFIAEKMISLLEECTPRPATIMHGDFCFSNILYNSRSGRVRLLDPRGTLDGQHMTVGGDIRYDMAKLAHSIVGRYDLILAGRFTFDMTIGSSLNFDFELPGIAVSDWLEHHLWSMHIGDIPFDTPELKALLILLFLSMLPLHADRPDRQRAFLANTLRLYHYLFESNL